MTDTLEVGGYFELELNQDGGGFHTDRAISMVNGRSCLQYILEMLRPSKIYLPFFSCHVLLEPILATSTDYEFLAVNRNLEFKQLPEINDDEVLLYINYFGLKDEYTEQLISQYGSKLILDQSHAFFIRPNNHQIHWSFNTARKFFGVPDGAYLYHPHDYKVTKESFPRFTEYSIEHLVKRLEKGAQAGFQAYKDYEASMPTGLIQMSSFSKRLLEGIDYEAIKRQRRENFHVCHELLHTGNQLKSIFRLSPNQVPFSYPYLSEEEIPFHSLWEHKIFVPILWPECLKTKQVQFENGRFLASRIIHIPIDHRYSSDEMNYIVTKLKHIEEQTKKYRT